MGVHGLWRLIEPSGKPVPLETLENKILAVDISIWLHQAVKGFQDSRGAPLPNAHLLGIYHRVCKLLYFRIKPIFVFDGGVPALKKQTIVRRNQAKTKNLNQANDIQSKLLKTLLKQTAVSKVISEKAEAALKTTENETAKEDMFKLPELPATEQQLDSTLDSSHSSDDYESSSPTKQWDLHTIDEKSEHFRSLPADVRHEILTDIKDTRKQSSWGRIHELPTESNDFSLFQMRRLLKRYSVQVSLEEAEKEMGGHSLSLGELEALLNEQGVVTSSEEGKRIASNENARYLLIKDVQKAMEKAKRDEEKKKTADKNKINPENDSAITSTTDDLATDKEFQNDLAAAIQLSLQDQPSTSKDTEKKVEFSFIENFEDADFQSDSESEEEQTVSHLKSAKSYMVEYSGLTPNEIAKIINVNNQKTKVPKKQTFKPQTKATTIVTESKTDTGNKLANRNKLESNITEPVQNKEINAINNKQMNEDSITGKNNSLEENKKIEIVTDIGDSSNNVSENEKIGDKNIQEGNTEKIEQIDLSDSDDSDFVEVNTETENKIATEKKSALEIVINPVDNLQDDIFSDIFTEIKPDKSIDPQKTEKIPLNSGIKEIKIIPKLAKNTEEETDNEKTEEEVTTNLKTIPNEEVTVETKQIEPEKPRLTVEELNIMKSDLVSEQQQLLTERNAKERMAGNITDQMYQEAQELLELFGVPYIIAPMEAEAQCAFLDEIDLTDGTITDDSDIWLFGGKTVYKNFFNHNKHVFEFRSDSIEHHFKLTREQLILLALLVGSDYTLGLQGIGPVTALEILAAFPPAKNTNVTVLTQNELITGLSEFRRWLSDGRGLGAGRTTLRSKLRNVSVSEGFPNLQVVQAYLQPKVETCRDRFTWAKPDIVGLIDFAKEKFGWTRLKSEEILKPVMKKLDDKNVQKTIRDYFATKHKIDIDLAENKMSKRVKTAVKKMGKSVDESEEEETPKSKKVKTKTALKKTGKSVDQPDEKEPEPKTTRKRGQRKTETAKTDDTKKPRYSSQNLRQRKPASKKEKDTKEYIPQRERDKIDALKSKLKAIEVFRKSKLGPGFVKKRDQVLTPQKEAELSESSSDSD